MINTIERARTGLIAEGSQKIRRSLGYLRRYGANLASAAGLLSISLVSPTNPARQI